MKHLFLFIYFGVLLLLTSSCHSTGDEADAGRSYQVSGTLDVDSTWVLDHLVLYADNHLALKADTLILSAEKSFFNEGQTKGFDELYLCSDGGELCRFFATGGNDIQLTVTSKDDKLEASFVASPADTINPWMTEHLTTVKQLPANVRRTMIDSLCHQNPADIRNALLIRELIETINDSIFVRRCLGALTQEAKPEWLMKNLDQILLETAPSFRINRRLSSYKWQTADSIPFDMSSSRSEYLLVYCWADYDQTSIDSLKMLQDLVSDEYDMKRMKMFSLCMHAPDSAWWKRQIEPIEGIHALVPAGMSDKRMRNWRVEQIPSLFICDMYGNVQQRNVWGKALRDALNRVPNKSGFAHTPKTKPHGR